MSHQQSKAGIFQSQWHTRNHEKNYTSDLIKINYYILLKLNVETKKQLTACTSFVSLLYIFILFLKKMKDENHTMFFLNSGESIM